MFKAIFTNSFGILISRILGFVRDLLTASTLGANIYSDIFFIAFKLPNLFRRIFAEGAFTQVFLPAYAKSRHRSTFATHIFSLFLLIILALTLMVNLAPSLFTKAIAIGFDDETIELAKPFVAINFWYLIFIFVVTFLATLLQYKKHFATTAFSTGLLNIAMIIALLLASQKEQLEVVYYLSWGVVAGGALQLIAHIVAVHHLGYTRLLCGGFASLRSRSSKVVDEAKKFKKQFLPAIWGNSSAQFSAFLDTWLASFLASGSISYLYYANRVFQLPLALFAIATSIALFPTIAKHIKDGSDEKALLYTHKAFWFLAYLLTFSTIGAITLSEGIVKLLFERGAFSSKDTAITSLVLSAYMAGLLAYGLQKLFSLWLYAKEQQLQAAKIATVMLVANLIASLALIYPLGAVGLALGTTISGFIGFFMTLRLFGWSSFMGLVRSKHSFYLSILSILLFVILMQLKEFLYAFI